MHVAAVTQFDSNFEVDHDAVAAQVRRLVDARVDGIVACGTMGEANCISDTERGDVLRTVLDAVAGRVPVCAGISSRTAREAVEFAKDAELAGAQSLMSLPPLLYRAAPAELMAFFREVRSATDLPLMIYNNPKAAGVDMPPTLLAEVVSQTPNATAVKECSGDARR